jgi:C1A family cysteine protease
VYNCHFFKKKKQKKQFVNYFLTFFIFCYDHEKNNIYRGDMNYERTRIPDMHAIMIIGYGDENGTNFWTIRNSWGYEWGQDGYGRIARPSSLIGYEKQYLIFGTSYPVPC